MVYSKELDTNKFINLENEKMSKEESRSIKLSKEELVGVLEAHYHGLKIEEIEYENENLVSIMDGDFVMHIHGKERISTEEMLEAMGWTITCQSPFEIEHTEGSRASGQATQMVIDAVIEEYKEECQ